jgi:hypothetical protein
VSADQTLNALLPQMNSTMSFQSFEITHPNHINLVNRPNDVNTTTRRSAESYHVTEYDEEVYVHQNDQNKNDQNKEKLDQTDDIITKQIRKNSDDDRDNDGGGPSKV